jgi:hypothetical protein
MDSCGFHALTFNYHDVLFSQTRKARRPRVYLSVYGLYLALEGGPPVGRAGSLRAFCQPYPG